MSRIPIDFDFLNPMSKAFSDFEFSDIVFSKLRNHADVPLDTNIVIVNIGFLNRNEISKRLNILRNMNPKVIGIDVFFENYEGSQSDKNLVNSITKTKNIVLANALIRKDNSSNIYDSINTSNIVFLKNVTQGYANLITDNEKGFMTVRSFKPQYKIGEDTINAFSLQCVKLFDRKKYITFLLRNNSEERINYERNVNYNTYMRLDIDQLDSTTDKSMIENKIVLVGFLGINFNDSLFIHDKFFTPMNQRYAGKTFPDMYGVIIHANIISMILSGNFINTMSDYSNIVLAMLICFLDVLFLSWLFFKSKNWYDEIASVLTIVEIILILYVSVFIYNIYNYQFDTTIILLSLILAPNSLNTYEEIIKKIKYKKNKKKRLYHEG
ncbi:MAG: CHASE2 domain-containing protein [Bacteroidetes bacterium]|nr:CHASE2 domain-containing protein [Bacteroidota bacterium]